MNDAITFLENELTCSFSVKDDSEVRAFDTNELKDLLVKSEKVKALRDGKSWAFEDGSKMTFVENEEMFLISKD